MAENNTFFDKMKRIFSTSSSIVNVGGNKIKLLDLRNKQLSNLPNNIPYYDFERYGRLYQTLYNNPYNNANAFNYQIAKIELYKAYESMDRDSIIASILDIFSDESSQQNEYGEVLQIKSSNSTVQEVLNNLFYDIMNIEFNLWTWIRNLCKYGDFFLKLNFSDKYGIINIQPLSAYAVVRIENLMDPGTQVQFLFDPTFGLDNSMFGGRMQTFEEYEIAHFRLISDTNFLPYGRSILEPARKSWEQLTMLEDAMLINRIMRAPAKRVFKVDVGNIPPNEINSYMEMVISKMKKVPYVDENTGNFNLKFNLQNALEDFYVPVRGDHSGWDISTLEGLEFTGIDDVEYIKNRMLAALKVPKAFIGYDESINSKSTLAGEDLRFARTIERTQRIIESELYKIALIHLYLQGFRDEDLVNFKLNLTPASSTYEEQKIALWQSKMDLVSKIKENKMLPQSWTYKNVLNIGEEQYKDLADELVNDAKLMYRLGQIEQAGADPKDVAEKGKENTNNDEGENDWKVSDNSESNDEETTEEINHNNTIQDKMRSVNKIDKYDAIYNKDDIDDYTHSLNFRGGSPLAVEQYLYKTEQNINELNKKFNLKKLKEIMKSGKKIQKKYKF